MSAVISNSPYEQFLGFFFAVLLLQGRPALALDQTLVLEQVTRTFGPVRVDIAANGAKIENRNHDKVFLCTAPTWDVLIYNPKRKVVYRLPMSVWSKQGVKTALALEDNDSLRWTVGKPEGTVKYAGFTSALLSYPRPDRSGSKQAYYTLTREFKVHRNVERFLQAVYDLPWADGIPLRFRRAGGDSFGFGLAYNRRQEVQTFLETRRAKRTGTDAEVFKTPVNYKTVAESEIFVNRNDANEAYSELMGK